MSVDPFATQGTSSAQDSDLNRTLAEGETVPPGGEAFSVGAPAILVDHPRYRIIRLLGSGGMGAVYEAEHRIMGRPVAIKVIRATLVQSPLAVERFRREVHAAARLIHPNIVTAYDAEQAGDVHFLAMEFVNGVNLAQVAQGRGPLPVADACDYVRQAALGLQHAHECDMVHRDIKPHNLMLSNNGQIKILDFGLARFASENGPNAGLTEPGTHMGTPDYMAPEQARDPRTADIRADIYSLGCTLYHLLVGHEPFPGGTALSKVVAHMEQTPRALNEHRADVPPELEVVLGRMMAKEPNQRYQTPAAVAEALAPYATAAHTLPQTPAARKAPPPRADTAPIWKTPAAATEVLPGKSSGSGRWFALGSLGALVIVAVALGLVLRFRHQEPQTPQSQPPAPPEALAVVPKDVPKDTPKPPVPEVKEIPRGEPAKTPAPTTTPAVTTPATTAPTVTKPAVAMPAVGARQWVWPEESLRKSKILAPDFTRIKSLYHDDFSDRQSGWPERTDHHVELGYGDNGYFMKSTEGPGAYRWSKRGSHADFACQVDGRIASAKSPGWGLVLLGQPNAGKRRGLQFRLTSNDFLQVFPVEGTVDAAGRRAAGAHLVLAEAAEMRSIRHPAIKSPEQFNALLLVVHGGLLEIYVNGVAVCDPMPINPEDLPFHIGLTGWFGPKGGRVEFARLTVWPAETLPSLEARGAISR